MLTGSQGPTLRTTWNLLIPNGQTPHSRRFDHLSLRKPSHLSSANLYLQICSLRIYIFDCSAKVFVVVGTPRRLSVDLFEEARAPPDWIRLTIFLNFWSLVLDLNIWTQSISKICDSNPKIRRDFDFQAGIMGSTRFTIIWGSEGKLNPTSRDWIILRILFLVINNLWGQSDPLTLTSQWKS